MNTAIIPSIVTQHAEEAAFLWLLRDKACGDPHYDLADLAQLDERLEANLDGLRIAGEPGWEICREEMAHEEPGEIFAGGVLAFGAKNPDRMDTMLGIVELDTQLQRALISALGWIPFETIAAPMEMLIGADLPFLRYIGLAAHGVHRQDPGDRLVDAIQDEDATVRARALKAAGELGRRDMLDSIKAHYREEDDGCRFYAAWSGGLLGDPKACLTLTAFVENEHAFARQALDAAVRSMDVQAAVEWLTGLSRQQDGLVPAIRGFGALGEPSAVPDLLEWMQAPELARQAGEAFAMITGADLDGEDLATDEPQGVDQGPSDDPDDDDVAMDKDQELPWPDAQCIHAWWQQRQQSFSTGTRYLAGHPLSADACQRVLVHGYQRQRMAASRELALLQPGSPIFAVKAPGYRQPDLLAHGG